MALSLPTRQPLSIGQPLDSCIRSVRASATMFSLKLVSYDLHAKAHESEVLDYLRESTRVTDSFYVWTTPKTADDIIADFQRITPLVSVAVFDFDLRKWAAYGAPEMIERLRQAMAPPDLNQVPGLLPGASLLFRGR